MNHSIEAETQILSAIMLDPDTLLQASDILNSADFYSTTNRLIYEAMLDLYQLGISIDIITLSERLQNKELFEQVGGIGYISHIISDAITSANIKMHSRIVHEKALIRKTGLWAANIAEKSKNGVEDITSWLGEIESDFTDIAQIIKPKSSPYAQDIIVEIEKDWDSIRAGKENFISTPEFLCDILPVFCPGHLWVIGGYTSHGKSTLLSELICDTFSRGGRPLLFSTEDMKKEKFNRLIANLEGIPYRKLLLGQIQGYEEKISHAQQQLREWNPIIYDNVRNIDDIRLITKKHRIKDNINIVCLDYIQNLFIRGTLYETMVDAILKFNAMIKDFGITGIVLSQIDNESARKSSNIIGLKGAGEIAATAEVVLWLERCKGKDKKRFIDCLIRKNKPFGEVGLIELMFDQTWTGIMGRFMI